MTRQIIIPFVMAFAVALLAVIAPFFPVRVRLWLTAAMILILALEMLYVFRWSRRRT